jgi:hypothetical protein
MAGFNINNFQSNISQYGVLQTNKFIVAFTSPLCMQGTSGDNTPAINTERLVQVRAESVKIPGITLVQTDVNRYGPGPMQKMPFNAQFTANGITFISDRNGEIYKYFYKWLTSIFDFSGTAAQTNIGASYSTEYKDNYTTDLHIYVYDNSGNLVKDIVMYKAYPESMNEINLGWDANNQLMKITVSMSFRDWAMVGVDNKPGTGAKPVGRSSVKTFAAAPAAEKPIFSSKAAGGGTTLSPLGQNEFNPNTGKFNGILGTGSETPTFDG